MKNVKELCLSIGEIAVAYIAAWAAHNALRDIRYRIIRKKCNRPKPLTKPLKK